MPSGRGAFPCPKAADKHFRDFGFKLSVIEELMYRRDVPQPWFDIHAFAQEQPPRRKLRNTLQAQRIELVS